MILIGEYTKSVNNSMTHLEIIKDAYNKCEIKFVIREEIGYDNNLYSYLFFTGDSEDRKEYLEQALLERLLSQERFMEFDNGQIASY